MSLKISLTPIIPSSASLIKKKLTKREIDRALKSIGKTIRKDFQKTTKTWKRRPKVQAKGPQGAGTKREIIIFIDDEIYYYVSKGTRAHLIPKKPKKIGSLAFPKKFKSKTRPGVIGSRAGFRGGGTAFAKQVRHPGTKARQFDKAIIKRRRSLVKSEFDVAFSNLSDQRR